MLRIKKRMKNLNQKRPQDSTARGKYYDEFVKEYGEALVDKLYTHQQVADKIGVSRSLVTKMYIAYLEDKENFEAKKTWKTPKAAEKSLKDFKDFRDSTLELKQERNTKQQTFTKTGSTILLKQ